MKLSDHSLRQLDATYLDGLDEDALRLLSAKLLEDLKEARERLNQNSRNSSRPPSSEAPWADPGDGPISVYDKADGKTINEVEEDTNSGKEEVPSENADTSCPPEKPEKEVRRAGKVEGAQGYGRKAPERIDLIEAHAPDSCACCDLSLSARKTVAYTGHYEVDWIRTDRGDWQTHYIKHLWHETLCECGHLTRAEPPRRMEDAVEVGGFRLIGSGMATLIVALSLRYRLSRARIREFLSEWQGVWLSVGAIHNAIEEAGLAVVPVEAELIEAVQQSGLLHADETPWPEQGAKGQSLWLWVFTSTYVTLYYVSHRGQELTRNLLENYSGRLMSDGWQAYRWLTRRLRCWAHLKRKAVGLTESFSPEAQDFGQELLTLWAELREAVLLAREGPPESIRAALGDRIDVFRSRCETMRTSTHKKTRELAGEFLNDWDAIFAVLDDPRWPLTNNHAERTLRHWVILRQLSHGTRTERGSRGLALLASVSDTCRQRGHSPWDYLQTAIARHRQNLAPLPLPA